MKIYIPDHPELSFDRLDRPDVDLRGDRATIRAALAFAERETTTAADRLERAIWTAVAVLAQARLELHPALDTSRARALATWLAADPVESVVFWLALRTLFPPAIVDVAITILDVSPTSIALIRQAAAMAPTELRAQLQRRLAHDPRATVREHWFAILGQLRRLSPPGSIPTTDFAPDVLTDVLHAGVTDRIPAVRERALAAAIGMNVARDLHHDVMACVDDADPRVRRYALVALGTLDDAASLARLDATLGTGTQDEATSAVWALALRPDGLAHVLARARDRRDWIVLELLQALAEVSAPMTDAQLALLARTVTDPRLPRVIERHLARTRRPSPPPSEH